MNEELEIKTENIKIDIQVENDYSNRFDRSIFINQGDLVIESGVFDARSKEAKRLALSMIRAAEMILIHHDLD